MPVVVVISGGQAFTMEYASANANAILHTFLQGELGGVALAEILTGETNPRGGLTVSIHQYSAALPIYYNYMPGDRKEVGWQVFTDYQAPQMDRLPHYPFGYGLSYTEFTISDVSVTNNTTTSGSLAVQATVTNIGAVQGKEVVQVYYSQTAPVIERPVKNLIRFTKVDLAPGASMTVQFSISADEPGYFVNGVKQVDADDYTFFVGSGSDDADLTALEVAIN